jgi:23S rRNA (guanosine2251-2'-O)-methyltransferase
MQNNREYIYGINPAFEVLRAGRRAVYGAYFSESLRSAGRTRKLIDLFKEKACKIEFTDKKRLFELSRTTEHQGVVIAVESYPYSSFQQLLKCGSLLLLDNIEDPQNVGAILRSAEIFGWRNILLSSRGTPAIYPSVVKASAGATEYVHLTREHSANYYVREALKEDFTVIALDRNGKTSLTELKISSSPRILLVVGGEHKAVGQFILNCAHHLVSIPQAGRISSLNASVAAGIAMFMLREQNK